MNLNQLNVYFYVRASSVKGKRGTLYTRVVVNSEQLTCSVKGIQMYPNEFDHKTQNPKKNCDLYFECQNFMVGMRQELNRIHNDFEKKSYRFTKDNLVEAVQDVYHRVKHGHKAKAKTYIEVYDLFLRDEKARIGKTISLGTYDVRKRYKKIIERALIDCNILNKPMCNLDEKDVKHVQSAIMDRYVRGTASRIFPVFSMAFEYAVKMHEIGDNPCKVVSSIKREKAPNLIWLEEEEVQRIIALELTGQAKRYRDAFVFCCKTGLSIGDYELLNPKRADGLIKKAESPRDIQPGRIVDYQSASFIEGRRRKTGTKFRIPILPEVEALIEKYGGIENMPYIMTKSGGFLQTICDMAGIKKPVRFHTARKTMANYCLNVKMMNPYYVVNVMGWSKIEEAEPYAVVNNETLAVQLLGK